MCAWKTYSSAFRLLLMGTFFLKGLLESSGMIVELHESIAARSAEAASGIGMELSVRVCWQVFSVFPFHRNRGKYVPS